MEIDFLRDRAKIKEILQIEEYGFLPKLPKKVWAEQIKSSDADKVFCAGKAPILRFILHAETDEGEVKFPFSLCLPQKELRFPYFKGSQVINLSKEKGFCQSAEALFYMLRRTIATIPKPIAKSCLSESFSLKKTMAITSVKTSWPADITGKNTETLRLLFETTVFVKL